MLARVATAAGLWSAGDASCQLAVPHLTGTPTEPYDWKRTARQALFGGVFMASVGHGWYGLIEKFLPGAAPMNAIGKVAADQLVFAPGMLSCLFYTMARMEGHDHAVGEERVSSTLLGALMANWTVWPAVQAVNLTLTPLAHRVTVVNLVCIPWTGASSPHLPARKPSPPASRPWSGCSQAISPTRITWPRSWSPTRRRAAGRRGSRGSACSRCTVS